MMGSIQKRIREWHEWLVPPEAGLGWMPYIWLVFFGWFFVHWLFEPPGTTGLILSLATTVAFLALYFSAFRRQGLAALMHCLALLALGMVWAPVNIGANVFFIFAAACAHQVGPPRTAAFWLAFIILTAAIVAIFTQPMVFFWAPAIGGALAVGAANIFFAEKERHNAALRLSQAEVRQLARVAERERIARDLHDLLGHRLSVIVLKSELARKLFDQDPDRARAEIRAVEDSAREALTEVREAIGGYRERSLAAELEQARLTLASAGIELDLELSEPLALDSRTEAVLALVIREAITNILRHARAHRCSIRLEPGSDDDDLVLEISDDGSGVIRPEGGGVDGMRARIEALGGRFRIAPAEHRLEARLPLAPAR